MGRLVIFAVVGLLCSTASAHALNITIVNNNPVQNTAFQLISSTPYDREEVSAPQSYTLRFSQPLKPDKSYVRVFDMYGSRVNDDTLTSDGLSLTTELKPLPPGRYTVRWQARCRCDNDTVLSETFRFVVK